MTIIHASRLAPGSRDQRIPSTPTRMTVVTPTLECNIPGALKGATVTKKSAISAWESLFRAQVTVMRTLNAEFPRDADLSLTEYDVLFTISKQPDRSIRLRDLRTQVLLTQPSVSRLIDRLVERGLVSKCPEPDDARGSLVRLTDAGYDLYRRCAVPHGRSIIDHVGGALSAEELTQLQTLTDKLRVSVEENSGSLAEHPNVHPRKGTTDAAAHDRQ
ncbi:hypothetical protein GCM10027568_31090 [Humibacter soli]